MQRKEIYDIWSFHKRKLYLYISEKTKRKSDVEDILHEVFIKFWTNHNAIKDKEKTLNWLISVAKYTIADYYRLKENTVLKSPIDSSIVKHDTEQTIDESKKLILIINSLPIKYKTVLLMSEIYGIPHKEIAEQFDLSVSCVKTRVVRARKLLSEQMRRFCEFEYDKYGNIINCDEKPPYFNCQKENKKKVK